MDHIDMNIQDPKKLALKDVIQAAEGKTSEQTQTAPKVFLFRADRSGERMGKPGDANNVYYAAWFEFYTFGPDRTPQSAGSSLCFKDPITHKPVQGGNGLSEVDVIEAFRHANPGKSVVMLGIEPYKGNPEIKMNQALQKYREDGQSLLELPAYSEPSKRFESAR